ncbi:DUF2793 domain-containing protein [Paracoccus subflavus]|uniref:DUF2793 domain-containing protein n=1 Tax=Paracoccus subflavus TaxID=2528244 RepID=A0A4Q9G4S0_9RHOB|nr:DUF2793 domain-containing protein [Paracoccus subflavus]TBN43707.1 DUF2793 domain-containing protein [Paracoccus subflavus]
MSTETARLQLPLLQSAQAQKHVTVNEALMRLDGMANIVLESTSTLNPPEAVIEGQCWGVPLDASGAWARRSGKIAIGANGGWIFVDPTRGLRAFVADTGLQAIHTGQGWFHGGSTLGATGAGLAHGMADDEVTVGTGTVFDTRIAIPANAMVIGAVARVTQTLTGSLQSWRLGSPGSDNRFGQGLGKAAGSWARGMLGTPMTYYSDSTLIMTAEGGMFDGGNVKLAVHWMELRLPD